MQRYLMAAWILQADFWMGNRGRTKPVKLLFQRADGSQGGGCLMETPTRGTPADTASMAACYMDGSGAKPQGMMGPMDSMALTDIGGSKEHMSNS